MPSLPYLPNPHNGHITADNVERGSLHPRETESSSKLVLAGGGLVLAGAGVKAGQMVQAAGGFARQGKLIARSYRAGISGRPGIPKPRPPVGPAGDALRGAIGEKLKSMSPPAPNAYVKTRSGLRAVGKAVMRVARQFEDARPVTALEGGYVHTNGVVKERGAAALVERHKLALTAPAIVAPVAGPLAPLAIPVGAALDLERKKQAIERTKREPRVPPLFAVGKPVAMNGLYPGMIEFAGGYVNTPEGVMQDRRGGHFNRNAGKYIGGILGSGGTVATMAGGLGMGYLVDRVRNKRAKIATRAHEPEIPAFLGKGRPELLEEGLRPGMIEFAGGYVLTDDGAVYKQRGLKGNLTRNLGKYAMTTVGTAGGGGNRSRAIGGAIGLGLGAVTDRFRKLAAIRATRREVARHAEARLEAAHEPTQFARGDFIKKLMKRHPLMSEQIGDAAYAEKKVAEAVANRHGLRQEVLADSARYVRSPRGIAANKAHEEEKKRWGMIQDFKRDASRQTKMGARHDEARPGVVAEQATELARGERVAKLLKITDPQKLAIVRAGVTGRGASDLRGERFWIAQEARKALGKGAAQSPAGNKLARLRDFLTNPGAAKTQVKVLEHHIRAANPRSFKMGALRPGMICFDERPRTGTGQFAPQDNGMPSPHAVAAAYGPGALGVPTPQPDPLPPGEKARKKKPKAVLQDAQAA